MTITPRDFLTKWRYNVYSRRNRGCSVFRPCGIIAVFAVFSADFLSLGLKRSLREMPPFLRSSGVMCVVVVIPGVIAYFFTDWCYSVQNIGLIVIFELNTDLLDSSDLA